MNIVSNNDLTLYLIKKPTAKDISFIKDNFAFHPSVIAELTHPTLHPKIEFYDNHAFFVLRLPQLDKKKQHNFIASEVDFIINKNQLIVVQYNDFESLDILITQLRHEEETISQFFVHNAGFLMYKIINHLFRSLYEQLDHVIDKVDSIEEKIFEEQEEKMLQLISYYRRETIDFRRIIKPNIDVFPELNAAIAALFNKDTAFYLNAAESTASRLVSLIENQIETLHILHETNTSILSNKINKVMKLLTMFAVIVFPLTLLSSIWGMNVSNIPFSQNINGFWILAGIMGGGVILMLLIFKLKKWM